MSFLFSKDKRTPYEKARDQTREFSRQIQREKRQLDRQIAQSDREIQRLSNDIRKHALNNNKDALRTLAKAIVKIKHNKSNLYSAKANLDTIENAVKNQLTNVRITGVMQKSGEIAHSLSELMKVDQLQGISEEFSKELMKMGIMSEMTSEAIDAAMDNDEFEEEANEEVKKVLDEILGGQVRELPSVVVPDEPTSIRIGDDVDIEKRLQALKS